MKPHASLLLALLATAPLSALRAEGNPQPTAGSASAAAIATEKPAKPNSSESKKQHAARKPGPSTPHLKQDPVPYIGVMTREVPPELRSHFALRPGFGVMVEGVMPDSPAEKAGLKSHDILLKLDDQHLVSMEQLVVLVRDHSKGDVVKLTVISGGREMEVPVTLGEHDMPAMSIRQPSMGSPSHGPSFLMPPGMPQGGMHAFQFPPQDFKDQMDRFQKEMREYQQLVQEWANDGAKGPMPQPPVFQHPPAIRPGHHHSKGAAATTAAPPPVASAGPAQISQFSINETHAASSVTRRDDSGEYTLKRDDGQAVFTARPKDGTEQSWPVNTDAERAAIPAEFREKLRLMDGPGSGVRIEIKPTPSSDGGNAPVKPAAPAPSGGTI
ncbi:MAG: PDZ domain-containing protein [Prosthecobacter sp.]